MVSHKDLGSRHLPRFEALLPRFSRKEPGARCINAFASAPRAHQRPGAPDVAVVPIAPLLLERRGVPRVSVIPVRAGRAATVVTVLLMRPLVGVDLKVETSES